jgi:hypothetical protein
MAFLHKHNSDNIHSRAIIVGLVNMLNNKIQYQNVLSDTEIDVVEVPWFFAKSADERFLQDYFTFWSDCIHPKLANGNYDVTPRGVISLSSKGIDSSSLTNRFVRGSYVKEINGKLETFNSYINSLPIRMNFECEIKCSSYTDGFKIEQALIETFYKVQVFNVSFKGFRIPCQVGLPEDFGLEKNFEYSYGDDSETTIKFSLELETYYPVMDKTSERHESNRMSGFGPGVNITSANSEIKRIEFISPVDESISGGSPEIYYIGSTLPFSWETVGSILRVDIEFSENGTNGPWKPIEKQLVNSGAYDWKILGFNDASPYIVFSHEGVKEAVLRPIIDSSGGVTDIVIFDGGLGYDNTLELKVEETGKTVTSAIINPIIIHGTISGFSIIEPGSGYTPTQQKLLTFRIKDSNNDNIYSIVDQIRIV